MKNFWTLARITLFAATAFLAVTTGARADEALFKVEGTGLHRANEEVCIQEIPVFRSRLKRAGVAVQNIECQAVEGEPESFEPKFTAFSRKPAAAETAVAIHFDSSGACEQTLKQLTDVVRDADTAESEESILEAGCVPMHIIDTETGEYGPVEFQPMVILLKMSGKF